MSQDIVDPSRRKLALKRANERIKLAATFFNGIGIASVVVAIISPIVNGASIDLYHGVASGMVALAFHGLAQLVLQGLRNEEV